MHPYTTGQERYEQPPATSMAGIEPGLGASTGMVLRRTEHQALYLQFQNRYPLGALISELLQIQDGKFIVRVQAQVGGSTLSTGLSAAYTPEMAEDQARLRALEVLGVYPTTGFSTQEVKAELISGPRSLTSTPNAQFQPQVQHYSQGQLAASPYPVEAMPAHYPQAAMSSSPSASDPISLPQAELDWAAEPEQLPFERPQPGTEPQLSTFSNGRNPESSLKPSPASPPKRSNRPESESRSAKTASTKPPKSQPVDLSDVIAQTSVEVKRLQWTEAQGRQYLQKKYGKRSRQQLTDEELIDFLQFLESQPSPSQALF